MFGLCRLAMGFLLRQQADNTLRVAIFLADTVLGPILFLGGALLFVDLAARVGTTRAEPACGSRRRARRREVVSRARTELEEETMALYLMLTTLTEKGVQTLNSNPARLREVNHDVEELGAKILHQWASLGAYDFVNVVEAPDDLTIAKVSVALGARGSSKIESLPLVSVDDLLRRSSRSGAGATRVAKPVARATTSSGLVGSPGCGSTLNPPGATSFGVPGWKSEASSWI